jgi:hypothetical protein
LFVSEHILQLYLDERSKKKKLKGAAGRRWGSKQASWCPAEAGRPIQWSVYWLPLWDGADGEKTAWDSWRRARAGGRGDCG